MMHTLAQPKVMEMRSLEFQRTIRSYTTYGERRETRGSGEMESLQYFGRLGLESKHLDPYVLGHVVDEDKPVLAAVESRGSLHV